jgi:predicted metalloprotease with PDZ domain
MSRRLSVRYVVRCADARAHLLEVEVQLVSLDGPLPPRLVLFMPVWSPGSYLVREYARHVEGLRAEAGGQPLRARKTRKNAWEIETSAAPRLAVRYLVYCGEVSVRTNHVDTTHAFWNGPSTYLLPEGHDDDFQAELRVEGPAGWVVGTGLSRLPGDASGRAFLARSRDELLDCPVEFGPMLPMSFRVHDREHEFWVWRSRDSEQGDWPRLIEDTRRIVETEAQLLAGSRPAADALPYDRYAFLWQVSPRGRGGLEHANSCALLVSPHTFGTRLGYLDVLSLVAHEYLHLWNVKRIRPEGLTPYRYETENYTRQLWWFEGGTSYFDWRILRLANLATPREYTDHLASELARLADTPGALVHPLAEASFDAWIKAYRPDENSANSSVSYYLKGEVVCALFDLEIRSRTGGQRSLDDVLRHLWWSYGALDRPVPEGDLCRIFSEVAGSSLDALFARWVDSPASVDPGPWLAKVGLKHERKPSPRHAHGSLGAKIRTRGGRAMVDVVFRGGAGMKGGLEPGDEILAVGSRRVEDGSVDHALQPYAEGDVVDVQVVRDGWVERLRVQLDRPVLNDGRLTLREDASSEQLALLDGWLGAGAAQNLRSGG